MATNLSKYSVRLIDKLRWHRSEAIEQC